MAADDGVSLTAAREHVLQTRPVKAHVIVTHDLDTRVRNVMGLWSMAARCDSVVLQEISRELLEGILADCKMLQDELRGIERWARKQLDQLPSQLREANNGR